MTRTWMRRTVAGGAGAALAALAVAGTAQAATVGVTGDDGNPAQLTAGVTGQIRVMAPEVFVTPTTGRRYRVAITGPDGAPAETLDGANCWSIPVSPTIDYRGNGTYTVAVTEYSDTKCATKTGAQTFTFAIAAGVTLPQPKGRFLTRKPGTYGANRIAMPIAPNPGASGIEVAYKRNASVLPDGSLPGAVRSAYWDRTTGNAELSFPVPGRYTVIARATSGSAKSPWSAPITVNTVAPFEVSRVYFTDSRGPSYQLKGHLFDSFARGGKVQIQIAKGKKGGRFRSLGSARITVKGTFIKRFTVAQPGTYRLRYVFKGNKLVTGGKSTQRIQITRRVVYR